MDEDDFRELWSGAAALEGLGALEDIVGGTRRTETGPPSGHACPAVAQQIGATLWDRADRKVGNVD
jgi:hypothetical protein